MVEHVAMINKPIKRCLGQLPFPPPSSSLKNLDYFWTWRNKESLEEFCDIQLVSSPPLCVSKFMINGVSLILDCFLRLHQVGKQ